MTDELLDFIRACAADCVNANEQEWPTCAGCQRDLEPERFRKGLCLCCADTDEIPQVEAK
jgi:hypothetical protein